MSHPRGPKITRRRALAALPALALPRAIGPAAAAGGPERGGTLTLALVAEPTTLVSATNVFTPSLSVSAKVTEGLLEYDDDLNPLPMLATAWSIAPDGLSYTFKLRPGVKWHDGTDFSSADVAYSIMLLSRIHPRGRSTFANVTEVATPDALTAVFHLAKPAPFLIKALVATETPILPRHIYDGTDPFANPNGLAPIGTGPFIFKEWVRGSHIVYERNPAHWAAPRPWLDRLVVTFIPDGAVRSAAFETGRVDLGYRTPVALNDVARLSTVPTLRIVTKGNSYSFNVTRLEFNLDNAFFKNPKVRQAVAHAIDRAAIVRIVYFGLATPCATPIAPGLKQFSDPAPTPYPYDLATAERLLDEAGYPRGADRIRFRVPLDYNPIGDDNRPLAEYLRATLGRIGIGVDVRAQDIGSFIKRVYTDRDFAFTTNGASNLFDPTVGVQRLYWSKNFVKGVPFSNATHYSNSQVDALLEGAAVENDPVQRVAMFKEFQGIVGIDVPDINLCSPTYVTIANQRVHGHSLSADGVESSLMDAYVTA
ncbi:MAG TPA: ABC transporter substrate-binding protein [Acetobacteraceae bacterium]|jgi:peptide/nickel transport system substrate-binding protein